MRQAMMFSKRGTSRAEVDAIVDAEVDALDLRRAVAGNLYANDAGIEGFGGPTNTALAMTANRIYATEYLILPGVYSKVGFTLGTAAAAGKVIRIMFYDFDPATGLPGPLFMDSSGNIAADGATGPVYESNLASTLSLTRPRRVVAAIWSDGTPSIAGWATAAKATWGRTTASSGKQAVCYRDLTFGAPPDPFGAIGGYLTSNVPVIILRAV